MKVFCYIVILVVICPGLYAESKTRDRTITPLLNYEYLSFQKQQIHSPGEGIMFTKGNMNPSISEERDSLYIMGTYKQYFVQDLQDGYSDLCHSIDIMLEKRSRRHFFLGALVADSDKPFFGGIRTFIAGFGYGYEFIRAENVSLTLGAALAVGDAGIELSNGEPLPVLPVPIVLFNFDTSWLNLRFQFMTEPALDITLFPEHRIQLTSTFGIIGFRNIRDFLFDTALMYRLFSRESSVGDFAAIGIGVKNEYFGFKLAEKGKEYEVAYNSIYALIDLSFLRIHGGYSFNGVEIYDSDRRKDIGNGFFVNILLGWQF